MTHAAPTIEELTDACALLADALATPAPGAACPRVRLTFARNEPHLTRWTAVAKATRTDGVTLRFGGPARAEPWAALVGLFQRLWAQIADEHQATPATRADAGAAYERGVQVARALGLPTEGA